MKKLLTVFFGLVLCISPAIANGDAKSFNPFFGDKQNQALLAIGQGFDSGELIAFKHLGHPAPYYMVQMTYSQPTTFFKLPARQNINGFLNFGFDDANYNGGCRYPGTCDWADYTTQIFTLSEDVALLYNDRFYVGVGMGVGVQGKYNDRLNTKFLLSFRLSFGYRMTDRFGMELAMQHFSNADTGTENNVYDFWGLGVTYSF